MTNSLDEQLNKLALDFFRDCNSQIEQWEPTDEQILGDSGNVSIMEEFNNKIKALILQREAEAVIKFIFSVNKEYMEDDYTSFLGAYYDKIAQLLYRYTKRQKEDFLNIATPEQLEEYNRLKDKAM